MSEQLFTLPRVIVFDTNAALVSGAKANFYIAGTLTRQNTFTDSALTVAHANPVVADGNGVFAPIYLDATLNYKVDITDSLDSSLADYPVDNLTAALTATEVGTALWPTTTAETSAGVTPTNVQYEPGNVLRYGANTTPGTTDMSTAINNAISSGHEVLFPSGDYKIVSQITFDRTNLSVFFTDDAILKPDTALLEAVVIGGSASSHMRIHGLKVDRTTFSGVTENVGVKFLTCNQSSFYDFESRFSKYNFKLIPASGAVGYNCFFNLQGIDGFYNLWLATAGGNSNENKFFGGRMFDGTDTDTHIFIENSSGAHNQFYGISCEGNATQAIFCDSDENLFDAPRTEGTWTAADIVFGANAQYNRVDAVRFDITIRDYASDDTNVYQGRASGYKTETGLNNLIHQRMVRSGANNTVALAGITISGATIADPVVITATAHGLSNGDFFTIRAVVGMTELNFQTYKAANKADDTIELQDALGNNIDGTNFTAYSSAGYIMTGVPHTSLEDIGTAGNSLALDIYSRSDSATSFVWRAIKNSDGLVRASLTTNGTLTIGRKIDIEQSAFNFEPLQMGNHYFWMNGNDFRGSIGVPSGATDGALIATLT